LENGNPISLWQNLQEILKDKDTFAMWQHIHGGTTHFPIALLFVGALFDFGSSLFKQITWRHVGFWCLMLAALFAVVSSVSGLAGGNGWFGTEWSGRGLMEDGTPITRSLANHRLVALVASGLTIALALWRAARRDQLKGVEWVAFLAALTVSVVGILVAGLLGAYVSRGA
jgi:uncharacterized membrane protein